MAEGLAPDPVDLPDWFAPLVSGIDSLPGDALTRWDPPEWLTLRAGAVLILFGEGASGPDVLLIERAPDMRSHAGQPAFPGGAVDPGDDGPVAAALREAVEETGLEPDGVAVVRVLPPLWLPPSGFSVTPVVGYWTTPSPVRAQDPREVARTERIPIADLVEPANRVTVVHPSGYRGPGFLVADMLVWGFTAGLLDSILRVAGWGRPWSEEREVEVPA